MIMNPNSLKVSKCLVEPSIKGCEKGEKFQFMRNGYYCVDTKDSRDDALVFNRIVPLKSSFKPAK
jgi:glutaminyl-tRNA synthetase